MRRTLVLFAKPPLPGVAKTRLADCLGAEEAALIATALLRDTLSLCENLIPGEGLDAPELILAYTHDHAWFAALVSPRWRLLRQEGRYLGERLDQALLALNPSSQQATVFIGMDAPHLPVIFLQQAFAALGDHDAVLGPCDDGGFYLVGVRGRWSQGILDAARWSTKHALADTHWAFAQAGLSVASLPPWYDVDDFRSLGRLARDLQSWPDAALPHVRAALAGLDLGGVAGYR